LVKIHSLFQLKFLDEKFFFKYLLDSKKIPSGRQKRMGQHPHLLHPVQPAKIKTSNNGFEPLHGMEELWPAPGKRKILLKKRKTQRDDR
jgi:hypothetical protein